MVKATGFTVNMESCSLYLSCAHFRYCVHSAGLVTQEFLGPLPVSSPLPSAGTCLVVISIHTHPSHSSKAGQTAAPRQKHIPVESKSADSNGVWCVPGEVLVTHCPWPIVLLYKFYRQGN